MVFSKRGMNELLKGPLVSPALTSSVRLDSQVPRSSRSLTYKIGQQAGSSRRIEPFSGFDNGLHHCPATGFHPMPAHLCSDRLPHQEGPLFEFADVQHKPSERLHILHQDSPAAALQPPGVVDLQQRRAGQ